MSRDKHSALTLDYRVTVSQSRADERMWHVEVEDADSGSIFTRDYLRRIYPTSAQGVTAEAAAADLFSIVLDQGSVFAEEASKDVTR